MLALDSAYLHSLFIYNPSTGALFSRKTGKEVGTPNSVGYKNVKIDGKYFRVHRVIFALAHGYWPTTVDHKDHNPLNNRLSNLRPASMSQNSANARKRPNTSSKYKGVSFESRTNMWRAQIWVGKAVLLGRFVSELEAAKAYDVKAVALWGEYALVNGA